MLLEDDVMATDNGGMLQNAKMVIVKLANKASIWFEEVRIKITEWLRSVQLTPLKALEVFSYLGVGFFVGFLFKKYLRAVFLFAVLFVGVLWVLEAFDLVIINWSNLQILAHVTPNDTIGNLVNSYVQLAKQNLAIVISGFLGFVIGYRVG